MERKPQRESFFSQTIGIAEDLKSRLFGNGAISVSIFGPRDLIVARKLDGTATRAVTVDGAGHSREVSQKNLRDL